MTVYAVTGYTDLHDCGHEDGTPQVFSRREDAEALVKSEYARWREEHEYALSEESLESDQAWDCPPGPGGAGFTTDRDDKFDWTITECTVIEPGCTGGPVIE